MTSNRRKFSSFGGFSHKLTGQLLSIYQKYMYVNIYLWDVSIEWLKRKNQISNIRLYFN